MAEPLGSTPPPGGEGGGGQADVITPSEQPAVSSGGGQPDVPSTRGQPPGDPLADYRDVFAEDPALLKTFTQHFGNEHAVGETLRNAHHFADQALNAGEKDAIKRLGLANDPIFLGALGRLNREYSGMRKTIDELTRENQRLKSQVRGEPVLHHIDPVSSQVLGGTDLQSLEAALSQQYLEEKNPEVRARIQTRLTAVQKTLYAKR